MRLAGASYEEIARAGGGILSTVRATRAASEDELVARRLRRLDALIAEGVTTVEVKSGYGLDLAAERKSLARRAAPRRAPAGRGPRDAPRRACAAAGICRRSRGLCRQGRRTRRSRRSPAKGLVDAVDAFCERIAFTPAESRARVRRRAAAWTAGQAARRPIVELAAARRSRPSSARCRPIISNIPTKRASRRWRRRRRRGPAAGRLLCPARAAGAAGRALAQASACRWRSRPTPTPAPRR